MFCTSDNHIIFLYEHLESFSEIVMLMDFFLAAPVVGHHLFLGDCPVIRHNDRHRGFWSNLGYTAKGLQIYMPLSKDLMLGVWSPEILINSKKSVNEAKQIYARYTLSGAAHENVSRTKRGHEIVKAAWEFSKSNIERIECIESGRPIELLPENVEFHNSLQLSGAVRHAVCPYNEYSLAEKWFAKKEDGA